MRVFDPDALADVADVDEAGVLVLDSEFGAR